MCQSKAGADCSQALPSPVHCLEIFTLWSFSLCRTQAQSRYRLPKAGALCQPSPLPGCCDPRPVLQQESCLLLFSLALCCLQEAGELSLLHPCSVQHCHKAQGFHIWAVLHLASVGPHWAPEGHPVPPIKGTALLQPPFLVPQRWSGKGLGLV